MKIHELHAELDIGFKKIVEYGKILGIEIRKPFHEIQFEQASRIRALHYKSLNKGTPIQKDETLNNQHLHFENINPFQLLTIELLQSNNLFDNRKEKLLLWNEKQIKTIFTDFEASSICGGLTDPHLQLLSRKYHKQTTSQGEVYELHYYAYEAYIKYGGETLTWLLTLPKLPFKAFDATSIFSELDKRWKKINSPIIRILFTNYHSNDEKMQLSFYSEDTIKGRLIYENIIQVKNQTTGKVVFRITREGIVIPESNAKNIIPILNLFIRFSKDTTRMIINYGLETGECSTCGRQLTTAESIKRGVGPICMQY